MPDSSVTSSTRLTPMPECQCRTDTVDHSVYSIELHCTLLSFTASFKLRWTLQSHAGGTLLSYAASCWATLQLSDLHRWSKPIGRMLECWLCLAYFPGRGGGGVDDLYRDGGLEGRSISLSQCTYVMPVNKRSFSICFQNLSQIQNGCYGGGD